jgi:Zn ribbon nucleic-acid-binding protein
VDNIRRIKYRCSNPRCKAEDTNKLFENEPIAPVINCWQCGAGRGMAIEQMLGTKTGMFVMPAEEQPREDGTTAGSAAPSLPA